MAEFEDIDNKESPTSLRVKKGLILAHFIISCIFLVPTILRLTVVSLIIILFGDINSGITGGVNSLGSQAFWGAAIAAAYYYFLRWLWQKYKSYDYRLKNLPTVENEVIALETDNESIEDIIDKPINHDFDTIALIVVGAVVIIFLGFMIMFSIKPN